jgi:hypothetical protein
VTDKDWFTQLSQLRPDEVNFWQRVAPARAQGSSAPECSPLAVDVDPSRAPRVRPAVPGTGGLPAATTCGSVPKFLEQSMKSGISPVVCTLLLLYCGASAAFEYSARAITARVVDAETKEPLHGVVVVAHWQLQGGLEGWSPLGELMVMDAVTDQSGTLHFPAWGPKKIPRGLDWNARRKDLDPGLLLFKSGYRWQELSNSKSEEQMSHKGPAVRSSDYNG